VVPELGDTVTMVRVVGTPVSTNFPILQSVSAGFRIDDNYSTSSVPGTVDSPTTTQGWNWDNRTNDDPRPPGWGSQQPSIHCIRVAGWRKAPLESPSRSRAAAPSRTSSMPAASRPAAARAKPIASTARRLPAAPTRRRADGAPGRSISATADRCAPRPITTTAWILPTRPAA
jgi:hypothetical protein